MSLILSGTDGLSDVDGSAATPAIRGTDANTGIFFPAADTIAFAEGGAEVARFNSSGYFGIGTTSPSQLLHVNSAGAAIGIFQSTLAAGNTNAETRYISTNRTWGVGQNIIQTSAIFEIADITASATRLAIDSSGNLGVGTTSPASYSFDTGVDLVVGDGQNSAVSVVSSSVGTGYLAFADGTSGTARYMGLLEYNHTNDYLGFRTASIERARINSAGMLSVNYTSAISGGLFIVSSNGTKGSLVVKNDDSVQLYSLGTGTVTCSGGVLGFTSDERIKIDDGNYSGGLNAVLNITPKYFYYKNSEGNKDETKGRELGFFAQNIQQTCGLEVVHQPEDPDALLGIHDRGVMAVLVSAIQEQQALIQTLTARITALESA